MYRLRVVAVTLGVLVPGCSGESACKTCVTVDQGGFTPSSLEIERGDPGAKVALTFTRTTDQTCARWVVIRDLQRNVFLPLNKPMSVEVPADAARTLRFQCGTGALKGTLVVR